MIFFCLHDGSCHGIHRINILIRGLLCGTRTRDTYHHGLLIPFFCPCPGLPHWTRLHMVAFISLIESDEGGDRTSGTSLSFCLMFNFSAPLPDRQKDLAAVGS